MAVQAQYPSNVLFLNRNGQEMKNTIGNEYLMQTQQHQHHHHQQQQQGGFLFDQSHMFNNNNGVLGVNPRKRARESNINVGSNVNGGGSSLAAGTTTTTPINLFSLQPQHPPPTLVNLSQLHNQKPNLVSTGLHLAFGEQQQQQQNQQNLLLPCSSLSSSILSEDLSNQINKQRDEIDQYLQLQGDQLRRTLAERRREHYRVLVGVAEESARTRLREKEAEVEKATRRNAELEQRVAQLRVEAQVWHNKARNQEANAASLQLQLQQAVLMQGAQDNNRRAEEGVGCSGEGEAEDAESAHIDPERAVMMMSGPSCKACQGRVASVVLLPCRHLCLCTNCNAGVDTCPVCLSFSSSNVEVFLS